jgi:hypothetical protein
LSIIEEALSITLIIFGSLSIWTVQNGQPPLKNREKNLTSREISTSGSLKNRQLVMSRTAGAFRTVLVPRADLAIQPRRQGIIQFSDRGSLDRCLRMKKPPEEQRFSKI